ncbi:NAD(P)-binding protein [bacterium]|nr:NAD(P)-binding protein [bacterium]
MTGAPRRTIAIVGGGASGVILAAHLMKVSGGNVRASVIERDPRIGRGIAYSTELPEHRLNVAASRMSAFTEDPSHLLSWFRNKYPEARDEPGRFLQRREYGQYLADVFAAAAASASGSGGLVHIKAECASIVQVPGGLELRLSNGTSLASQIAILATGHDPGPHPDRGFASAGASVPPIDCDRRVVILGSGLSMIDAWLTLQARGHRGEIVAVSRRGLLPLPHGEHRNPIKLDRADIPFGTELSYFVRWFSDLIDEREAAGGDWRDVIDGIRPFNQQIWRDWPISAKRRFLSHAKAWWDVHRHRIAPDVHARAHEAIADGKLRLIAGKVSDIADRGNRTADLVVRLRRSGDRIALQDVSVLDCTGIIRDPATGSNPLISSLITAGMARTDPLRIGLDVTPDCAIVNFRGEPSDRLFAIGPLTRGTFFEIDAVPEIREQCQRLAVGLVG